MLGKSGETNDVGQARIAVVEIVSTLTLHHRTARGNGLCVPFNQPATVLEHEL
jgi:hypothetical protein